MAAERRPSPCLCGPGGQQGQCEECQADLCSSVGLAAPPVPALAAGVGWGWVSNSYGKQQAEHHPRLPFYLWEPASPMNIPWVPGLEGGAAERVLPCQASGGSAGFEVPTQGELRGNHETWVRKPLVHLVT